MCVSFLIFLLKINTNLQLIEPFVLRQYDVFVQFAVPWMKIWQDRCELLVLVQDLSIFI